jgi:hypothetical protein
MPCDIYVKLKENAKSTRDHWVYLTYNPEMAGYAKTRLVKEKRIAERKMPEASRELSQHVNCEICQADGTIPKGKF